MIRKPMTTGVGALIFMAAVSMPGCDGGGGSGSIRMGVRDVSSDRATVIWTTADSSLDRFQLQQQALGTGPWTAAAEVVRRKRTPRYERVVANLEPGTPYCFRIRAPVRQREAILSDSHCIATPAREPNVSLLIRVRAGPFTSAPASCTMPLVWTFIPVRLKGTNERAAAFTVERNYDLAPQNTAPGEWHCFFHENTAAARLRRGRWQVRVHGTDWSTRCELNLAEDERISFTQHARGCQREKQNP
ncbi:MAG: fibronectin type III domain-containing protein [Longimicrobiales bacterium]